LAFASDCQVSTLGVQAFSGCSSLQSICIPSSIESICDYCFSNCASLSSLTFASDCKVSTLDVQAFSGCSSLVSRFAFLYQLNVFRSVVSLIARIFLQ
jgi:hypothetical protein